MQNITTLYLLLFSIALVASSNSFWPMWLGLEMNNFIFIPWMMGGTNYYSGSKVFKYFMIQVLASGLFLISIMNFYNFYFYLIAMTSMLIKLASFPFHLWVINLVEGVAWEKFSFLMTGAKAGGLMVITFINPYMLLIYPTIAGVIVPITGLKSSSMRKLLTFSSISHMSWILIALVLSPPLCLTYLCIYWSIFLVACYFFSSHNISSLKDLVTITNFTLWESYLILLLMGFPPALGFFPKLMTLKTMVDMGFVIESLLLGIMTIFPFYFYLKMLISIFSSYKAKNLIFLPSQRNNFLVMSILMLFGVDLVMCFWA